MDLPSTIHHLGEILGRVIAELESPAIFDTEETIRALARARRAGDAEAARQLAQEISKLSPNSARAIASAFTVYSDLVPDKTLAKSIFERISRDYDRTRRALLTVSGHSALMEADPILQNSVQLRNPYVDPLNYPQIEMLKRLGAVSDRESNEARTLQEVLDVTINGIAVGLRNTG